MSTVKTRIMLNIEYVFILAYMYNEYLFELGIIKSNWSLDDCT